MATKILQDLQSKKAEETAGPKKKEDPNKVLLLAKKTWWLKPPKIKSALDKTKVEEIAKKSQRRLLYIREGSHSSLERH